VKPVRCNQERSVYLHGFFASKERSEGVINPQLQRKFHCKHTPRVTVIGEKVFAVKIMKNGIGIAGDWRKEKENVDFIRVDLPEDIKRKCIQIVSELGLLFGVIDLILHNDKYYFIEVNPTGEWAWLINKSGLEIDKAICYYLQGIK
jgi:glutathione synthase/RimK-type ligase-like ATP-grasp enzyme